MSTEEEKIATIRNATAVAKKKAEKLELIQSCSKLSRSQEFELAMARECANRGEKLLEEYDRGKSSHA